jgi:hypothetical protein
MTAAKAYRGVGMEGAIATWYPKNTGRDSSRFMKTASRIAERPHPGSEVLERMVMHSRFGRSEITSDGVGFELRLSKTKGRER